MVRVLLGAKGLRALGGTSEIPHAMCCAVQQGQAEALRLLLGVEGERRRKAWANRLVVVPGRLSAKQVGCLKRSPKRASYTNSSYFEKVVLLLVFICVVPKLVGVGGGLGLLRCETSPSAAVNSASCGFLKKSGGWRRAKEASVALPGLPVMHHASHPARRMYVFRVFIEVIPFARRPRSTKNPCNTGGSARVAVRRHVRLPGVNARPPGVWGEREVRSQARRRPRHGGWVAARPRGQGPQEGGGDQADARARAGVPSLIVAMVHGVVVCGDEG